MSELEIILGFCCLISFVACLISQRQFNKMSEVARESNNLNKKLVKRFYQSADLTSDIMLAIDNEDFDAVKSAMYYHMNQAVIASEEEGFIN